MNSTTHWSPSPTANTFVKPGPVLGGSAKSVEPFHWQARAPVVASAPSPTAIVRTTVCAPRFIGALASGRIGRPRRRHPNCLSRATNCRRRARRNSPGCRSRLAVVVPPTFLAVAVWPGWSSSAQSQRPGLRRSPPPNALPQFRACCSKLTPFRRGQTSARPSTSVTRVSGALHVDVEHRAADADRRGRRGDRVGLLVERAGREPEHPLGETDRDLLGTRVALVDEPVEHHPRGRADGEIGRSRERRAWRATRFRCGRPRCDRPSCRPQAAPAAPSSSRVT